MSEKDSQEATPPQSAAAVMALMLEALENQCIPSLIDILKRVEEERQLTIRGCQAGVRQNNNSNIDAGDKKAESQFIHTSEEDVAEEVTDLKFDYNSPANTNKWVSPTIRRKLANASTTPPNEEILAPFEEKKNEREEGEILSGERKKGGSEKEKNLQVANIKIPQQQLAKEGKEEGSFYSIPDCSCLICKRKRHFAEEVDVKREEKEEGPTGSTAATTTMSVGEEKLLRMRRMRTFLQDHVHVSLQWRFLRYLLNLLTSGIRDEETLRNRLKASLSAYYFSPVPVEIEQEVVKYIISFRLHWNDLSVHPFPGVFMDFLHELKLSGKEWDERCEKRFSSRKKKVKQTTVTAISSIQLGTDNDVTDEEEAILPFGFFSAVHRDEETSSTRNENEDDNDDGQQNNNNKKSSSSSIEVKTGKNVGGETTCGVRVDIMAWAGVFGRIAQVALGTTNGRPVLVSYDEDMSRYVLQWWHTPNNEENEKAETAPPPEATTTTTCSQKHSIPSAIGLGKDGTNDFKNLKVHRRTASILLGELLNRGYEPCFQFFKDLLEFPAPTTTSMIIQALFQVGNTHCENRDLTPVLYEAQQHASVMKLMNRNASSSEDLVPRQEILLTCQTLAKQILKFYVPKMIALDALGSRREEGGRSPNDMEKDLHLVSNAVGERFLYFVIVKIGLPYDLYTVISPFLLRPVSGPLRAKLLMLKEMYDGCLE